jgi:DNA replication protein DnaC
MSKANTDTWSGTEEGKTTLNSTCPICAGAGFIHPRSSSGKPDYGRVISCQCINAELNQDQQIQLEQYSNIGALTRFTFDKLIPEGRSSDPRKQHQFNEAYKAAISFANNPQGWLILSGPSNCGKTHLAAAIANEQINQGKTVLFISTPDLLDKLRTTYNSESELHYDEFFDRVRNVPLLILDDLGIHTSTAWVKEKLDQLINHRFNNELPTVIVTTNPIEEIDDRLRTRLTNPNLCRHYSVEDKRVPIDISWESQFELQKQMTFENFDWQRVNLTPEQRQNLSQAFHLAFEFAKNPEGWVVFMGVTGCGKTHLAAAISNYRYQLGYPALFIVTPEFLDHLRSTFNPESKVSYDQLFEKVKTAPLLILDDFGEQSTTPWAKEKLYQVINYRYNARLATVITTRYSLEEIREGIEGSISSRLVDPKISTPYWIIAPDYRGDINSIPRRIPHRKKNWR